MTKEIKPKYKFVEEEGAEDITPIKIKIDMTMEVTERLTYYYALADCMKMEKAVEDKKAEIEGIESMIKAYKEEIELIEEALDVTEEDRVWNIALHEKLKAEEAATTEE